MDTYGTFSLDRDVPCVYVGAPVLQRWQFARKKVRTHVCVCVYVRVCAHVCVCVCCLRELQNAQLREAHVVRAVLLFQLILRFYFAMFPRL